MKRYCDVCDAERDENQCPECLEPTRRIEVLASPQAVTRASTPEEVTSETAPSATYDEPPPPPPQLPTVPAWDPEPAPDHPPASPPVHARDAATIPKARQKEIQQYIDDGYAVYLIAGIAGSGKTQLLGAYQQDAFLRQIHKSSEGHALPTRPNQLDCVTVPANGRKVVFVDAAGENFRRLHPLQRLDGPVPEQDVEFLRVVSSQLAGVVLLIGLDDLWADASAVAPGSGKRQQIEILNWVVMLLRWLQEDGAYPGGEISFQQHVNREVQRLRRRLKVPVLTLFSRADALSGLPVPSPKGLGWLPGQQRDRFLEPVGEDPLMLAYHRLPSLLNALRTHVNHFRIDFVHSLYEDPDTGALIEDGGCGLSSSLDWILDEAWRSRLPGIPTRWWLDLDRRLRPARWRQLPDPRPLA